MRHEIAARIPKALEATHDLLTEYGRWATAGSRRIDVSILGRLFIREADAKESLEAFERRRVSTSRMPLMSTPDAMRVQRALAACPEPERVVLAILYIPRRRPPLAQLRALRIPPQLSVIRHLEGLRQLDKALRTR